MTRLRAALPLITVAARAVPAVPGERPWHPRAKEQEEA